MIRMLNVGPWVSLHASHTFPVWTPAVSDASSFTMNINSHCARSRAALVLTSMLLFAGFLAGCGDAPDPFERIPVKGTVTLDGEPIEFGTIQFTGERNEQTKETAFVVAPVRDGTFSVDDGGTTAGTNEVFVIIHAGEPRDDAEVGVIGTWTGTLTVEPGSELQIKLDSSMLKRS